MGIIAFALTGICEARKKGMDVVGVCAVASCMGVTFALRMVAIRYDVRLPL